MEEKKNILTYEGLKKYEEELHDLKVVKRKEVAQKIKEAREQGDLSENAEYDAAKDEQRDIEARIEELEKILKNAEVVVEEEVDPKIKREGDNLHQELYISFAEAALGTQKEIPTVGGKVKIKVDAGTQSGKILRLSGKGLPSIDSYGKGDMFVHINVWTPQHLSPEQKEFFENQIKNGEMMAEPSGKEKTFFDKVRDLFN